MKFLLALPFLLILMACGDSDTPEYPFEQSPYLELESYQLTDTSSLAFTFNIWDEEGDLGVPTDSTLYYLFVVMDSRDRIVTFSSEAVPPFYSIGFSNGYVYPESKRFWKTIDDREDFNCQDYWVGKPSRNYDVIDTLWVRHNGDFHNFLSTLKINGEEFVKFNDWECQINSFDRIFKDSNSSNPIVTLEKRNRYLYQLTYVFNSVLIAQQTSCNEIFSICNSLEFAFRIRDEALNYSNEVTTGEFYLSEVEKAL